MSDFNPTVGRFILASTIIGAGMVYLDGTIITVALEPIRLEYQATVTDLQWLLDLYLLFLTIPILVAGSLSDRYGRRRVFNIGLIGFTVASAACGVAQTIDQLNLARIFQGVFGGVMLPGSLAILNATFPPEERGRIVGTWSALTALTTALGPLLGGLLVDLASWRAAFLINVPLGAVAYYLSQKYIPETYSEKLPEKQDWLGALLVTIGLSLVMYGLIEGPAHRWESHYVIVLILGVIVLIGFGIWERYAPHPMLPISLFRRQMFGWLSILTLLLYFSMSGILFLAPLVLQQTHNLSATLTGLLLMPLIILLATLSGWSGRTADKTGGRYLVVIGSGLLAFGILLSMIPSSDVPAMFPFETGLPDGLLVMLAFLPATVVFGAGLGLTIAPLTTMTFAIVPRDMSGLISGYSNAVSRVATILAVALLGAVMVTQFLYAFEPDLSAIPLSDEARQFMEAEKNKLGAASPPPGIAPELQEAIQQAIDDSFISAFRTMIAFCGMLALLSAFLAYFFLDDAVLLAQERDDSEVAFSPHL